MAAATVSGRRQNGVFGNRRVYSADAVTFATTGDTLTVPGMKRIESISYTKTTNASNGFTVSANVLTIVSGGALTGILQVIGI